jgi:phosphoribosylaminoimidazolecarboxamide formyltransferase/IMP cyclohydrolase
LLQDADSLTPEQIEFKQVSENQMSPEQLEDLKFAWR